MLERDSSLLLILRVSAIGRAPGSATLCIVMTAGRQIFMSLTHDQRNLIKEEQFSRPRKGTSSRLLTAWGHVGALLEPGRAHVIAAYRLRTLNVENVRLGNIVELKCQLGIG
jgi:hypothetical protein